MTTDKLKLDEIVDRQLKINPRKEHWFVVHMIQASRYEKWAEEEEDMAEYWKEWAEHSYILAEIFSTKRKNGES